MTYKPRNNSITSTQEKLRAELHHDFPDISKLRLTEKQHFLRTHRDLILQYCEVFGDDKTMLEFHMKELTLWQLKGKKDAHYRGMTKQEETELRCKLAIEKVAELEKKIDFLNIRLESLLEIRKETRQLRASFDEFSQITADQIIKALLTPLLQSLVSQYGGTMPPDNGILGPVVIEKDIPQNKRCLKGAARWSQGY